MYIGSTETPFKQWVANYLTSLRHEKYENSTELSKYVWKLKREGKTFQINWSTHVLRRALAYSSLSEHYDLCLMEKMTILSADRSLLLNERSDLVSKCHHQNKFFLLNFTGAVT